MMVMLMMMVVVVHAPCVDIDDCDMVHAPRWVVLVDVDDDGA
jgi:hypothetical protein